MTFDFRSVPCGDKLTVTFFPGLVEHSLRHFLEEQGITGWSIVSKRDALARLVSAQPRDLDASEIEVRLGATWIAPEYIQQFMAETFQMTEYYQEHIRVVYVKATSAWFITNKNWVSSQDVTAYTTYGTDRRSAYDILEESLNLRDVRVYDAVTDPDGKERRVLNAKQTTLAAQKQQMIKDAFRDWLWKDPERRQELVRYYNETRHYEPESEDALRGLLTAALPDMDEDMQALARQTIRKLEAMTDADFEDMRFLFTDE